MPQLLVSVRSAAEAAVALAAGADLIDVKEPARGALGRADDAVIKEVVQVVAGKRPVSAALGELSASPVRLEVPGVRYLKWGLSGCGKTDHWQALIGELRCREDRARSSEIVPVAYADWENASAPPVDEVSEFVCRSGGVLLLDTFDKTRGASLLDYLTVREITELCRRCQARDVKVALAGSLNLAHIAALKDACPDWFAVRGAACAGNRRGEPIDACKVRELADVVAGKWQSLEVLIQSRPFG